MPWVHVSAQDDAFGASGWLIVPTRSAPLLGQRLVMMVPSFALRWLPHFEGWWVSAEMTAAMFRALNGALHAHDLCSACAIDGAPCEEASATALERAARAVHTQSMMNQAHVDAARERSERTERWRINDRTGDRSGHRHGYAYGHASRGQRFVPPPVQREDPVKQAANALGLTWPATKSEIEKKFRHEIARAHPDLGGTAVAADKVIKARKTLLAALQDR